MPVPHTATENSPRKLLRDVVYDKMLAAIQDGTLQPGERLNDDELVQWLGVSRTPIREAIAKLVDAGLVEMEANRFTRIATPTTDSYINALDMFIGLQELSARWALPAFTDADVKGLDELIATARAHVAAKDDEFATDIVRLVEFLVDRAKNPILARMAEPLIARVQFLAVPARGHIQWEVEEYLDALSAAAAARDGEAGGAAVRILATTVEQHVEAFRAAATTK